MKQVIAPEKLEPAAQLALDEAMLEAGEPRFRVWQFDRAVVVMGRSSRVASEVRREFCDSAGIPTLRRCTGGASVVGGPGCWMYSVVLPADQLPATSRIDAAHRYVMDRVAAAVSRQVPGVSVQGTCDLTWAVGDQVRKCGGNSLRVTRAAVLYHGTVLVDFDLSLIERCLDHAPRQPDYRRARRHGDFVTNVPIDPERWRDDMRTEFDVVGNVDAEDYGAAVQRLRSSRYDDPGWHHRH